MLPTVGARRFSAFLFRNLLKDTSSDLPLGGVRNGTLLCIRLNKASEERTLPTRLNEQSQAVRGAIGGEQYAARLFADRSLY